MCQADSDPLKLTQGCTTCLNCLHHDWPETTQSVSLDSLFFLIPFKAIILPASLLLIYSIPAYFMWTDSYSTSMALWVLWAHLWNQKEFKIELRQKIIQWSEQSEGTRLCFTHTYAHTQRGDLGHACARLSPGWWMKPTHAWKTDQDHFDLGCKHAGEKPRGLVSMRGDADPCIPMHPTEV